MGKAVIRLKDIANDTGFSTNTVSLALRDSPRIPKKTRETIQSAALKLNYLPNQIAKSLVSRETKTIGLVLTDITNPTLTHTAQALGAALDKLGYSILFATSNNRVEDEKRVVEMFRSRQVDGMLIYPASHRQLDHIRPLRRANYPVVLLVADPDAGIDAVSVNDRSGAHKATQHLIDQGHTRIGIIDGSNSELGNSEKSDGYHLAMSEAGLKPDPTLMIDPQGHSVESGKHAMARLMAAKEKPTAVFAANDTLAIGILSWCRENNVTVPDDLALVGYDNIQYGAFASPPLTTVNYAAEDVAIQAVNRLIELIKAGDLLPDPRVTLIDPDLIVRDSS